MSIGRVNENEISGEKLDLFLKTDSWKTSAQFFYANKENFLWFSKKFDEMFTYCMERKIMVLEEKIFGVIIAQNRDNFNVWIGRYIDCLKNSYRPRGSIDLVIERIRTEQNLGNHNEAFRLAKYLYLSKNDISVNDLFICLDFIVVNAYYVNQKEEGKNACKEMIKLAKEDFNIMYKLKNELRYASNFKFYDEYI